MADEQQTATETGGVAIAVLCIDDGDWYELPAAVFDHGRIADAGRLASLERRTHAPGAGWHVDLRRVAGAVGAVPHRRRWRDERRL